MYFLIVLTLFLAFSGWPGVITSVLIWGFYLSGRRKENNKQIDKERKNLEKYGIDPDNPFWKNKH